MLKSKSNILLLVLFVLTISLAFAQQPMTDGEETAACAACAGMGIFAILIPIAFFVVNILLLVWVAKDAKARGMSGIGWMILVFFTSLLGLLIYILSRPKGNLIECSHCGNKRLEASAKCPHCGN